MARQACGKESEEQEDHHMAWSATTNQDESVDFQDSTVEETGLTTTYDLPGIKSLPPRPTPSKQRVARVNFSNILFSHTIIAKYKPVAYLKAKIRNTSRLTLLKGETGLTLDGTFLGRARLPRCSDGDIFSFSLGIDPAIKFNYPKVDVRRTTTGLFSKENSSVYTRSVTVSNTRAAAGKPVSLLVLDQIPVSEDERLKVDLLVPKGLVVNGSEVLTGRPAREGKDDVNWGKATASLKRGGQIDWQVTLNAGMAVKLGLEYVVALPSGDSAVEC
ncbi:mucoidy inhibitor-like protein [Colletotrichum tofieldiae]|nr:mucoidy inhibitor-like protein [Colletotrichum tofieldiae]